MSESGWAVLLLMGMYVLVLSFIISYHNINDHITSWYDYYERRDGEKSK